MIWGVNDTLLTVYPIRIISENMSKINFFISLLGTKKVTIFFSVILPVFV